MSAPDGGSGWWIIGGLVVSIPKTMAVAWMLVTIWGLSGLTTYAEPTWAHFVGFGCIWGTLHYRDDDKSAKDRFYSQVTWITASPLVVGAVWLTLRLGGAL